MHHWKAECIYRCSHEVNGRRRSLRKTLMFNIVMSHWPITYGQHTVFCHASVKMYDNPGCVKYYIMHARNNTICYKHFYTNPNFWPWPTLKFIPKFMTPKSSLNVLEFTHERDRNVESLAVLGRKDEYSGLWCLVKLSSPLCAPFHKNSNKQLVNTNLYHC